jgi:hypothetical protein
MTAWLGIAAFVALVCLTNVSWAQDKKEEPKAARRRPLRRRGKDPTIEDGSRTSKR